ncbi:expressed unknown protein [Seminavis robusta]|uniref:Uncharacterized protein n=1 Tax=Seminavis robusta TaxID=568900 RepID=A0A9N8HUU7_9STRA|nr:expressed unknown protein [Seminavis robusta]|eukprot:Sro1700_g292130.1 n/a (653) ;mRNA; r:19318-21276
MQVTIPEFYIALVLSEGGEPSPAEYENLRLATCKHLLERLSAAYSNIGKVDLKFLATEFGTKKPDPKFQVFVEAEATISCSGTQPKAQGILETLLGTFDRDFLLRSVRRLEGSPFASAVEVQARRLKRPTAGGSVKAPAFYMAFVCSRKPSANPSSQEKESFLQLTQEEATRQLRKQYDTDFDELSLSIVKTEINESAGKPEPQYNLYVQFEATAKFSQNTPSPNELFQGLGRLVNAEYLQGVQRVGDSFMTLTTMVLRLCIFTEGPEPEEDEAEDGEGAGGGGDGEEEPDVVNVRLEFFVALVVRTLSTMPEDCELEMFDGCITKFFTRVLKRAFRGRFLGLEIVDKDPEFEKGCPLPRFNMLHQYQVNLQFYDPAPGEFKILSKITQGNVGPLFDAIKKLESDVWRQSAEATMGRAVEKPPTDVAFGGSIFEEKKEVEPVVEPEPEPKAAPPPPKKEPEIPEKPVEKIPERKSPSPPKEKPTPPKKKPTPPKKKAVVPRASPPKPVGPQIVSVRSYDIFSAYQVRDKQMDNLKVEPTAGDYDALVDATKRFYVNHLKTEYGSKFHGMALSVRNAPLWGAGKPERWYNVYIDWDIEVSFVVAPEEDAPTRWELTKTLVSAGCNQYLRSYVRGLEGTAFAHTSAVFTKQVAV